MFKKNGILSTMESQISGKKYTSMDDSDDTAKARLDAVNSPFDPRLRIALAKALADQRRFVEAIDEYSLSIGLNPNVREAYRMRGAYYLCTMRLPEALADFSLCCRLFEPASDVLYRIGVVWYLYKQYEEAAKFFEKSLEIASEGDQIIGSIDWIWMSYMLAGNSQKAENALLKIPKDLVVGHHTDYVLRTDLYRGKITVKEALSMCKDKPEMEYITCLYGIMVYCRVNGEANTACKLQQEILSKDNSFITFAYLAAYAESRSM